MAQVRRMQARDAEAVARLSAQAAQEEGVRYALLDADHVRMHGCSAQPLFEAWIAEASSGRGGLRPVGHAIATTGYDVRKAVATIVLAELFVIPEQRGSGVARQLMSAVAGRAMELGARELMITTGVDNAVARRFFAAVGAQEQPMSVYMMESDEIEWLAAEAR